MASNATATVIVELFTSEGCSSCPPADELLGELIHRQPIGNVTIIGLGEHVDYWDRLGWRDPFSSAIFTSRQSEYESAAFHTGSIYTPQLVVDGRFQAVGSDRSAVAHAIQRAAQLTKATIRIGTNGSSDAEAALTVDVAVPSALRGQGLDVFAGVVERDLVTNVRRGENRGRTLKHAAVVRTLKIVGAMSAAEAEFSKTVTFPIDRSWKRPDLEAVVFVQERTTRHIIGAASLGLSATVQDGGR